MPSSLGFLTNGGFLTYPIYHHRENNQITHNDEKRSGLMSRKPQVEPMCAKSETNISYHPMDERFTPGLSFKAR